MRAWPLPLPLLVADMVRRYSVRAGEFGRSALHPLESDFRPTGSRPSPV
jgi:hypothetical protein